MGDALYCNVHFAIDQISFEMHLLMGCAPTQIMLVFFFNFVWCGKILVCAKQLRDGNKC